MAVILTRCTQTATFIHQSDGAWAEQPEDLWVPANGAPSGATRWEVRPLNSEALASMTTGDAATAVGKVCAAGLVSIDGADPDAGTLPAGWQTDICTLIIEVSNGPLAAREAALSAAADALK